MANDSAKQVLQTPAPQIQDEGWVRIGTMSATFPPARVAPPNVGDARRIQMGTMSPTFPLVRAQ
jgi:hypothetical protein